MEILVIGKPAVNIYLPLQGFPLEGDVFTIKSKNESLGNVGATAACLLGKWGMRPHFTGVVGNDAYAEKVRTTFQECKVDGKFLEASFEKPTSTNHIILNAKTGVASKILFNDPTFQLAKYKYDFIPGFAVIDSSEYAGALAFLNNNASAKTVYYARVADKETITNSKRCTWVVCTQTFAEGLAHFDNAETAEDYVNLYQKIVDSAGNSNYIVILNNHKILYCVDGKVKMLPEMKINVVDYSSFDSIFVGTLAFGLVNNMELDDAIKLANTAAAISISRIGEVPSIPTVDEVLDNSGLREKLGLAKSKNETPVQAQEVTPLQPGYSSVPEQPVQQAYDSTPQMQPMQTQPDMTAQAFSGAPMQAQPVAPSPVQTVPQQVETNMFDNPNV